MKKIPNRAYCPLHETSPSSKDMRYRPDTYDVLGDNVVCHTPRSGAHVHGNKKRTPCAPHVTHESTAWKATHKLAQRKAVQAFRRTHGVREDTPYGYKVYYAGKLAGIMVQMAGVTYWRDYLPSGRFGGPEATNFNCDPSQLGRKALADFLCVDNAEKIKKWPLK